MGLSRDSSSIEVIEWKRHTCIYTDPMLLCWLSRTTVGTWLLVRELSPAYVGHSQKSIHVSYYMYIYTYILNTYMYIYRHPLFQCWLVTSPVGTWLLERGLSPAYSYVGATKEGCGGLWEHAYHQVSATHISNAYSRILHIHTSQTYTYICSIYTLLKRYVHLVHIHKSQTHMYVCDQRARSVAARQVGGYD